MPLMTGYLARANNQHTRVDDNKGELMAEEEIAEAERRSKQTVCAPGGGGEAPPTFSPSGRHVSRWDCLYAPNSTDKIFWPDGTRGKGLLVKLSRLSRLSRLSLSRKRIRRTRLDGADEAAGAGARGDCALPFRRSPAVGHSRDTSGGR